MPDNPNLTPIQAAWRNFTNSVRELLVPQPDDRPLDQYLEFRDTVLGLVESDQVLQELDQAWGPATDPHLRGIDNVLLLELNAFPRMVEVAQATQKPEEQKQGWGKMLSRASTISGSVKDLLDNLPPYARGALTLLGELLDLFKAKD